MGQRKGQEYMEALEAIKTRRSIRKFAGDPVSADDVRTVLEAAMAAPSAGNEQPWQFVVISDRATLDAIPAFHEHAGMMREAPLAVLVCADDRLAKYDIFWPQDCAAATQNLLLAAHASGLGAVWVGVYPVEGLINRLREMLALPPEVTPFALVAVGRPAERKPPAGRFDPGRIHHERWEGKG
jgi:nitroreductase